MRWDLGFGIYLLVIWLGVEPKMAVVLLYPVGVVMNYHANKQIVFSKQNSGKVVFLKFIAAQTEKLLGICKQAGATTYLSGPAAKDYFDEDLTKQEGIKVEWMDYSGYPEYNQLHPPFEHGVSVLDLIFNEGPNAKKFMKSIK